MTNLSAPIFAVQSSRACRAALALVLVCGLSPLQAEARRGALPTSRTENARPLEAVSVAELPALDAPKTAAA